MSDEKNLYQDSLTGKVESLDADQASVFPHRLRRVPEGTKPFLPGMFTPGLLDEVELPDPVTEQEEAAQAVLESVLEENAPNSKIAREARAELREAQEAAEKAVAEIKE